MLPGRAYKPEDIIRIARQRIWWVLVPAAIAAAGAAAVAAFVMPLQYRSTVTLQISPTQIPTNYVRSTITASVEERLQAVAQRVYANSQLDEIIVRFDLYPELRTSDVMSAVRSRLRRAIQTSTPRGETFTVSFTHHDKNTAQAVADHLGSQFINFSAIERNTQVTAALGFFETQLTEANAELQRTEEQLTRYKIENANELPSQLDANLTMLRNLRSQIRDTQDSLQRDYDQRAYLQRTVDELRNQPPATSPATVAAVDPDAVPTTAAAALGQAKAQLAAAIARGWGPEHPDRKTLELRVRDLTAQAEQEALAMPLSTASNVGLPPEEVARRTRITDTETAMTQLGMNIARKEAEIKRFEEDAQGVERRIQATTEHETNLTSLTRNYNEMMQRQSELFNNREDARVSAELEEQQGEKFQVIDAALVPDQPVSPDKSMITALGVAGGAALGLALIALFEYRDRSFKTDSDMARLLSVPVLAVVPFMQSDAEIMRARRRRWLAHLGFGSTVVVCVAVVAYAFLAA